MACVGYREEDEGRPEMPQERGFIPEYEGKQKTRLILDFEVLSIKLQKLISAFICSFLDRFELYIGTFLLDCKAYSQIRDTFFSKVETKISDFKSLSHDTLISLLMNSSDYLINCQLVSFISQCFELRTKNFVNGVVFFLVFP